MLFKLFVLFVTIPVLELALLVWIGTRLGFWPTMAIILATAAVGALLARGQGTAVLHAIRAEAAEGRVPVDSGMDGLLVLCGAVVLLTPGVLSDLFGIALLFPPTRRPIRRWLRRRFERLAERGSYGFTALIR